MNFFHLKVKVVLNFKMIVNLGPEEVNLLGLSSRVEAILLTTKGAGCSGEVALIHFTLRLNQV